MSSDDGGSVGGGLVDIRPEETWGERRTMPKLVLTNVEKQNIQGTLGSLCAYYRGVVFRTPSSYGPLRPSPYRLVNC
ncbi:predicted protein [Plenodomus lingam JN3]|uniref:Predicted protein n=1 Tax=Leptosphaeria maculans (strain JN3 / isolate v23.1.3 / race Av1-4-5-6-7-8) TaxID=985895 RepID=E5A4U8_LEPMJ|nr:predicted protein [Plenodomus lingam JN3]CBX98646.1 predicted protein [Plenodomus lingam JN3]